MILIQMPGRTGPVDLDELLDRLSKRGVIGATRRDVGADLHRLPGRNISPLHLALGLGREASRGASWSPPCWSSGPA